MGRARKVGMFATPSSRDEKIATQALQRLGLAAYAHRTFDALSGGERQLVILARANSTATHAKGLSSNAPCTPSLLLRKPLIKPPNKAW